MTAGPEAIDPGRDRPGPGFDLVVADASWSWTERLFAPMADLGVRTLLLKACDWRTALNQRRRPRDWVRPRLRLAEDLWERRLVLPPGWMKTYPKIGMRPLAAEVRAWRRSLGGPARPLAMAISYPHYLYLRDQVEPDALIYYNMDDYALYWAAHGDSIRALERRAVAEADLSVFCARVRAETLRAEVPSAASRVIHLPHGAPAQAIGAAPQHRPGPPPADLAPLPSPRLGFVGSLEDRLDWPLLERVARAFPGGSVALIGREPAPAPEAEWYRSYQRVIELPNVHRLGWKTQAEIGAYNAAFDVCLIPYDVDHPFNRAACPTKIMDYMATSRPVVASALPECRLYGHLFDVAEDAPAFVEAIRKIVESGSDDGRARARWEAARAWTWERASASLLGQLRAQVRR